MQEAQSVNAGAKVQRLPGRNKTVAPHENCRGLSSYKT